ncbi:Uncharacterised protein [Mycobacterium tuberculosis]|uniref:Uncharacterized protein n=1 Tax=Mycobacterium tuberculosis TaxID=1773 RepID=A0A0U0RCK1_MYCTX|nr:Uncharacterised protein [Mycobacterium tuberculosis]CKO75345.1 Uncharacterised protein [Mycobacterium tuberculosis]COV94062.1 Uncharacterised protein [Mycobacterium tuberculosis]COX32358.1 Uncharacterised protein [Mycobacterium tuberculosis]COX35678.1 Uncharacterised protein [Mycobacterium tuberculosis]
MIGNPCNGPSSSPRARAASDRLATRRAASGSTVTIALSDALYVSIRERYSSTNSALDTFLAASTAS